MLQTCARWVCFCIACISLYAGYLVYFLGRPNSAIYAIPENLEHWVIALPLLSEISGPLLSFFHTFLIILLIVVVLNPSMAGLILICRASMVVEFFFEFSQSPFFANHLTEAVPAWFVDIQLLDVTGSYFLTGIFDPVEGNGH